MSGGFWQGGFCPGGFWQGGLCPGGFCPDTSQHTVSLTDSGGVNLFVGRTVEITMIRYSGRTFQFSETFSENVLLKSINLR